MQHRREIPVYSIVEKYAHVGEKSQTLIAKKIPNISQISLRCSTISLRFLFGVSGKSHFSAISRNVGTLATILVQTIRLHSVPWEGRRVQLHIAEDQPIRRQQYCRNYDKRFT